MPLSSRYGLICGYAADMAFGDPRRAHPVAGLGRLALGLERRLYAPSRVRGGAYTGVLVLGSAIGAELLARAGGRTAALAVLAWIALGGRSLAGEAIAIAELLERGRLAEARRALPALCGRDADTLDETQISRAVVESLAENTSDAVVGALWWGALAGPAGVAGYRAANTLDAMVGHHNDRYEDFGWASARLDDALGWPAARLGAALSAALAPLVGGSPIAAARTVWRDGADHPSPNAGRMEAAFAGALHVRLGGELAYRGRVERRGTLGDGAAPTPRDIQRAARLSRAVGAGALAVCVAVSR
ncbi:MAG TPA: CobD/CbiB family cobalamin biosynthesis protein [Solirubrobacteraceae bacterium]|jgi:adenosylcobinamide-phosphate synthase|nr:CobD/CbiB family cobalamin biosynthesis protein [Solirubrobacteraceae bacterium]